LAVGLFAQFQIVQDYEVLRFNRSGHQNEIPPAVMISLANYPDQPASRREQHSERSSRERGQTDVRFGPNR